MTNIKYATYVDYLKLRYPSCSKECSSKRGRVAKRTEVCVRVSPPVYEAVAAAAKRNSVVPNNQRTRWISPYYQFETGCSSKRSPASDHAVRIKNAAASMAPRWFDQPNVEKDAAATKYRRRRRRL